MFKHSLISCSMALAIFSAVGVAKAEDPSSQDKDFVTEAGSGGMLEVQLGQYASQNAASDDVKKFGQQMVDDHSKTNDELKTIAGKKSIDVPAELNSKDQKVLDKLEKLSGADFDKAYASQMVKDHKKDIAAFKKESSDGSDSDIKAFAEKTLPTLEHHLEMAQGMNKEVK